MTFSLKFTFLLLVDCILSTPDTLYPFHVPAFYLRSQVILQAQQSAKITNKWNHRASFAIFIRDMLIVLEHIWAVPKITCFSSFSITKKHNENNVNRRSTA